MVEKWEKIKIFKYIKKEYILLILIILVGFFLRVYHLEGDSLWIDEGFTITETNAIAHHFLPLLDSGKYLSRDLLLPYLLVPIQWIFGDSVVALRFVSVLFGTASIVLAYAIAKKLWDRNIGMITAFFLSFSYWQIAWSRQVRAYILAEFLFLAVLFFLIKYHEKESKKNLIFLIIFSLFGFLNKISAILVFPSLIVYFLSKKKYKLASVFSFLCLFFVLPVAYYLRTDFALTFNNYLAFYVVGYFWMYYGLFFALAIMGAFVAMRYDKHSRSIHCFILSYFFSNLALFSFFIEVDQKRYVFVLSSIIFLYAAYATSLFWQKEKGKRLAIFIVVLLVVLGDGLGVKNLLFIPNKQFALEKYTPQPDFRTAYQYLRENLAVNDTLISPYPYMDRIYLKRSSYALAISYTGRQDDYSITSGQVEYYSGAPAISSFGKINALRKVGNVYILLDSMAVGMADSRLVEYVRENFYPEVSIFNDSSGDYVYIYKLPILGLKENS